MSPGGFLRHMHQLMYDLTVCLNVAFGFHGFPDLVCLRSFSLARAGDKRTGSRSWEPVSVTNFEIRYKDRLPTRPSIEMTESDRLTTFETELRMRVLYQITSS
jgi:hypothetical protein